MRVFVLAMLTIISISGLAQSDQFILLKADRVFDGESMHNNWAVLIKNNKIEDVGNIQSYPSNAEVIYLQGCTLLPGLIEGHSHLFLHPYNETLWEDQVLKESRAERIARAVNHARATLLAGFTTVRDLGTEGAFYDDAGLKIAIEKGVIPGPRMIVATRAIVAKGTYAPRSVNPDLDLPQGAAEVAGTEDLMEEVRTQINKGADIIKIYGDFGWGIDGAVLPTFSVDDIASAAAIANNGGRPVVIHATTPEGMRRAVLGGAATIEHGDGGTADVYQLMKQKKVALCPTLAAGEAYEIYKGWRKGIDPEPIKVATKKKSFQLALQSGVTICMGGDAGVFAHGENAREMELMAEYGMKPLNILRSATSVNADVFGYGDKIGRLKKGLLADVIAVEGDPLSDIKNIRKVKLVVKDGRIYRRR
ncbi:amidohydrolase family protein [Chitinophagaceae bacterium LB-8]|uniref:Amidohydrolase family protein n=1 Tax=Paraflavisolibacter caeni TaxID=2982496 RepID=A0A9X3BFH9_9BACT|nr:amidohydrolase family protein [Paraflavisolibacter caeni]MCU7548889.1 amidohydrolase family protein [Paraflavisolibacter caeni]